MTRLTFCDILLFYCSSNDVFSRNDKEKVSDLSIKPAAALTLSAFSLMNVNFCVQIRPWRKAL